MYAALCCLVYNLLTIVHWTNKGISYEAKQDPLYSEARPYLYAPDCVRAMMKVYLYYALQDTREQAVTTDRPLRYATPRREIRVLWGGQP